MHCAVQVPKGVFWYPALQMMHSLALPRQVAQDELQAWHPAGLTNEEAGHEVQLVGEKEH